MVDMVDRNKIRDNRNNEVQLLKIVKIMLMEVIHEDHFQSPLSPTNDMYDPVNIEVFVP